MIKTKFLIMDVDGTLTDGKIYMSGDGEILKVFNVKDGYGIKEILPAINIKPVILTGKSSKMLINRCKDLEIEHCYQGISNKSEFLAIFVKQNNLRFDQFAYIGDDLNDYGIMKKIFDNNGITACPNDAVNEIKSVSNYICTKNGGNGAVREFIEILKKRKKGI